MTENGFIKRKLHREIIKLEPVIELIFKCGFRIQAEINDVNFGESYLLRNSTMQRQFSTIESHERLRNYKFIMKTTTFKWFRRRTSPDSSEKFVSPLNYRVHSNRSLKYFIYFRMDLKIVEDPLNIGKIIFRTFFFSFGTRQSKWRRFLILEMTRNAEFGVELVVKG